MKTVIIRKLLLLMLLFVAGKIIAQPPPFIPLQNIATDAMGNPAKNRKIFIKDIIYQGSIINGKKVWEEAFELTTDNNGIYTYNVGLGTKAPNNPYVRTLDSLDWGHGPFFMNTKIAVSPTIPAAWWIAADNYVDLGTTQMASVPYALFAGNASVTNVTTAITPGEKNTFLVTDSSGNVVWRTPEAAKQYVTNVTNINLNLAISQGASLSISANSISTVDVIIAGVKKGDPIVVTPQGDYPGWMIYGSWVEQDDHVKIRFANFTDEDVVVKGSEYKIVAIK